jgi:hypothetical protein
MKDAYEFSYFNFIFLKAANAVNKEFLITASTYISGFLKAAVKFMKKSGRNVHPGSFWKPLSMGASGFGNSFLIALAAF